jgi:hypothetical protein
LMNINKNIILRYKLTSERQFQKFKTKIKLQETKFTKLKSMARQKNYEILIK